MEYAMIVALEALVTYRTLPPGPRTRSLPVGASGRVVEFPVNIKLPVEGSTAKDVIVPWLVVVVSALTTNKRSIVGSGRSAIRFVGPGVKGEFASGLNCPVPCASPKPATVLSPSVV
jgi:hypothetical protein